jgi:hypothetical protein
MNGRRLSVRNDEDTDPDINLRRSAFARLFPSIECWAQNKKTVSRLLEEAAMHEQKAGQWEKRGHFERFGFCLERAADAVASATNIRFSLKDQRKYHELLRKSVVSYALEMKERYDPGLQWRIYKVARLMGDTHQAVNHYKAAIAGFENMIHDPALDSDVRLGRLKRKLLERVCERDMQSAVMISYEALDMASGARPGAAEKIAETKAWVSDQFRKELGGGCEFYIRSIEEYLPGGKKVG